MGKIITDGHEDSYYGVCSTWCVGRLDLGTLLDLPEGEERWGRKEAGKMVVEYKFGKPLPADQKDRIYYVSINRWDFEEAIKNTVDNVMQSGNRGSIIEEVTKKLKEDYTISICIKSYTKAVSYINRAELRFEKKGEEKFSDEELTTDLSEIKPYLNTQEFDMSVEFEQPYYRTTSKTYNGHNAIKYLVEKILKEKYTYCTKMGKNIVPDKYIKDGEAGILAYQQEKRSKNKNNSIEKQLIKKLKTEKKQIAFGKFCKVMDALEGRNKDWQQVFLTIDGRWNTSRRVKTIAQHIINVSEDELIKMSEEEIEKRCKSYWVALLMEAQERIKNMTFEDNK